MLDFSVVLPVVVIVNVLAVTPPMVYDPLGIVASALLKRTVFPFDKP